MCVIRDSIHSLRRKYKHQQGFHTCNDLEKTPCRYEPVIMPGYIAPFILYMYIMYTYVNTYTTCLVYIV